MTDPIKALIAAFDAVHDAYIESDFIDKVMEKHFKAGFEAIAAIAAAEARPEPAPFDSLEFAREWQRHPVWFFREDAADAARLDRAIEALHRLMDWRYGPSLRSKVTTVDQVRRACEALNMLPEFDAMMEKPK